MTGYTITITPGDDRAAQTTIQVDIASGTAQITELTVRAAKAAGLAPHQLPAVDLGALIAALTPTQPFGASAPATRAARRQPTARTPAAGRTRREPAAASRTRAAATTKPTRSRRATAGKTTGEPTTGRRAYRRMPETKQMLAAYRRANGSATKMAEHFDVPRHTINGWIRRLRNQGLLNPNS